ncbi:amidophosphoribosyltransferase [Iocasia frigidifontis]|uniref:Amidophosphoribosyltransferase n=2 Tax=Iocasia fonsfrigidae TaxID=2682810 RepID=A0A8A7K9L0_9FIRM|nr:amidophosphoribosyltransferase [Iocasia fonsfrigidae]
MKKSMIEKLGEECGVFGIYAPEKKDSISTISYLGLLALQHRGQESAGICVNDSGNLKNHKAMGLVSNVFNEEILNKLQGEMAIGHVRYSTSGSSMLTNAQPLLINCNKGYLSLAHNGNLINAAELRQNLESHGSIFHSTLDTEVIAHLVARSFEDNLIDALTQTLHQLKGGYSIVAMTRDNLVAARDPFGLRPLVLGRMETGYVIASETCAFDIIGAEFIREIEPGELIVIDRDGIKSHHYSSNKPYRFCVFEFIYFARPDSNIGGQNVHLARREMGRQMAREIKVEADIVVPVPDSGKSAAMGFAEESGIPYTKGILRNRYVGRTFIQPTQEIRDLKVRIKLSPIKEVIKGKRVILVDDSIVRGTTSRQIINRVREAGAKEVHIAISSPPVINPCYYGIDISNCQELIARQMDLEGICEHIGADSLNYLSIKGLLKSIKAVDYGFCTACFSGEYPVGSELVNKGVK